MNYRTRADAESLGLIKYKDGTGLPYMGVDHTNKVDGSATFGRSSVRLESKCSFGQGLYVFDMAHLPAQVDGAWPAM